MDGEVDKGKMPGGSTNVLSCRGGRLAVLYAFWVAAVECLAVLDAFWVAAADDWRLFVCSGLAGKIAGGNPRLF